MRKKEFGLFLEFMKKFYVTILIYIISEVFKKYIDIYIIQIVGKSSDAILNKNLFYIRENLISLCIALAISIFIVPWVNFISCKLYIKLGVRFDTYVYNKFLRQKKELIDKYDPGNLIYRIEADPVEYRGRLLTFIGDGAVVLFVIIQSLFLMIRIHVVFAFLCLFLSMISILMTIPMKKKIKTLFEKDQDGLASILNKEKTMVENFAFIKIHQLKTQVLKMFNNTYKQYYKVYKKKIILGKYLDNFNEFINILSQVLIYIAGSYFIAVKAISVGEGIQFFGISIILKENAKLLSIVLNNYFEFQVSSKRVIEWTDEAESSGDEPIHDIYSIKGSNIDFRYKEKKIFEGFSFSLDKGEHITIKGSNGSGKSTLTKLITGIYDNYEGSIKINGKGLKQLDIDSVRDLICIAPQEPFLFDSTIFENVKQLNDDQPEDKINEIFKKLGLYNIKDKSVGEGGLLLSGGEKQKISLARAIIKNAPLTILDEPETALDIETKKYVIDFFKNSKNSLIVITHNNQWDDTAENRIINIKPLS